MPDYGMMVNGFGDMFYPDCPEDAEWFRNEHGAEFVGSCSGRETFNPSTCSCSCYGCKFNCGFCWRYWFGKPKPQPWSGGEAATMERRGSVRYRILITGSRDSRVDWSFLEDDWILLFREFYSHGHEFVMVHGDCPTGVDAVVNQFERDMSASWWAARNTSGPPFPMIVERHPAQVFSTPPFPGFVEPFGPWPGAGPRRNQYMVDLGADLCLAYPYGVSKGTRGCAAMAIKAGIPTLITEYEEQYLKPRSLWDRLAAAGIDFSTRQPRGDR